MAFNVSTLYGFVLSQLAAESYLDGTLPDGTPVWQTANAVRDNRLRLGNNNYVIPEFGNAPSQPSLPSQTRMTDAQVSEFNARYEVRDHLPSTMTGFSATLLWDRIDQRYVLSFRSTEFADDDKGGDWSRDGVQGAGGEISNHGFAVAQIGDMEAYYRLLQASGKLPVGANYMVTGYSLGGHLATVFAEAHALETGFGGAVTFNAPGHGTLNTGSVRDFVNESIWGQTLVKELLD